MDRIDAMKSAAKKLQEATDLLFPAAIYQNDVLEQFHIRHIADCADWLKHEIALEEIDALTE